ncbi:unnamed protein product, partial [Brassica oleracea]
KKAFGVRGAHSSDTNKWNRISSQLNCRYIYDKDHLLIIGPSGSNKNFSRKSNGWSLEVRGRKNHVLPQSSRWFCTGDATMLYKLQYVEHLSKKLIFS